MTHKDFYQKKNFETKLNPSERLSWLRHREQQQKIAQRQNRKEPFTTFSNMCYHT